MSQTEFHKGTLTLLGKVETKEQLKKHIIDRRIDEIESDDDIGDFIADKYGHYDNPDDAFYFKDGYLFKLNDSSLNDEDGGSSFKISEDTIDYRAAFYNGGTCLEEYLDEFISEHFNLD